jgi:N-dimethylarginine dimethylaminohydrolase
MMTISSNNLHDELASDDLAPVFVSSEWGELKECVYGATHEFLFPGWNVDADLRPVGDFRKLWKENSGRQLQDVDPEYFANWKKQIDDVVVFLEQSGIKVHRGAKISAANRKFPDGENWGTATGWHRDGFVTIGNNVIELAPRTMFHRRQKFATRHILVETMKRGARYFAQPDCGADQFVDHPGWGYLEGGDVFVLEKKILVGNSGHCSNLAGAQWLQHMLGPDYDVEAVPIDPSQFQHLDCVLCTPREGVAIACTAAFTNGLPEYIRDWDIIDVDSTYCNDALGTNHLVINDRTVMVPSENEHDHVANELKKRQFEVIRMPYGHVYRCGGSFRCAHQPLIRL